MSSAPLRTAHDYVSSPLPWAVQMHQAKGIALLGEGHHAEAAVELGKAVRAGGSDPQLHLSLAAALMHGGDWHGAGASLMVYLRTHPNDVVAIVRMGIVLRQVRKHDLALKQLRRALELDPNCAPAWSQIGEMQMAAQDWNGAAEAFRKAIAVQPKLVAALTGLAELCAQRDMPGPALEWFEEALAAAPPAQQGPIYMKLGKFLAAHKRWEEAAAAFGRAMARGGGQDPVARYEYALACLRTGQREAALQQVAALNEQHSHLGARLKQIMAL